MNDQRIDLSQTVYALCTQYPALVNTLAELGFRDITKPCMLGSVGRFMTIPKGAAMKKLDLEQIRLRLMESGYTVTQQEGYHE
jgi:hypothetical protein